MKAAAWGLRETMAVPRLESPGNSILICVDAVNPARDCGLLSRRMSCGSGGRRRVNPPLIGSDFTAQSI